MEKKKITKIIGALVALILLGVIVGIVINNNKSEEPVDVVFVDEAHLLLTQGKMSYRGNNQLKDIMSQMINNNL